MKKICRIVLAITALTLGIVAASSATELTPNQVKVKAMVEKAKAFYAKQGEEKALEAFSAKDGGFIDGDLYIFVVGYDGVTMANGGNSSLLGRQVATLKDADGKFFIKEMIDLSKAKGAGWIDYKWRIPSTGEIKEKTSYIEAAGEMFIGCGIYK